MKYIEEYLKIKTLIEESDAIVIGIGSGMSASGGLNYTSNDVLKDLYPEYHSKGFKHIFDVISNYWVTNINEENENDYWDFWTLHINNIRYKPGITKPYELLHDIVKGKNYYIITTNGDSQTQKAFGESIYAPQGDYSRLQCRVNCNNRLYDNKEFVEKYLNGEKEIPKCSCGEHLIPNLRCDDYFCEVYSLKNYDNYSDFIIRNKDKKVLLIEIGVGYNTPVIIRYPFDRMSTLDNITLVRINLDDAHTYGNNIGIEADIVSVLEKIKELG
ncbi:MAG: NAD-dependent protein deacetylase, SIR2 family [bacterium]